MEEAENELRPVTANNPGDYRSRNNLAGIYASKGKTEAALAELKQALETRPTYAAGWLNLVQLHAPMRNWKEAETALRKAANLDRNNATAHFLLAQVLDALGKKPQAADHLKTALKLDPRLGGRIPEKPRP